MALITNKTEIPFYAIFAGAINSGTASSVRDFFISNTLINSNGISRISNSEVYIDQGGVYQVKMSVTCVSSTATIFILEYGINGSYFEITRSVSSSTNFFIPLYFTINVTTGTYFKVRVRSGTGANVITKAKCNLGEGDASVNFDTPDIVSFRRL